MTSITVGGVNKKYKTLSSKQIERILEEADNKYALLEKSQNIEDYNDKFLEFLNSKEFSDLYKEVKNVVNKEVKVNLKFEFIKIDLAYFVDDNYFDSVICGVHCHVDKDFYNKFNNFKFLKEEIIYYRMDMGDEEEGRLSDYFMSISSYRGKDKELLKAKKAHNDLDKEFSNALKKTNKFDKEFNLEAESIFNAIVQSKNITEARASLIKV